MVYISKFKVPLGEVLLASDGTNLVGLWLEGQQRFAAGLSGAQVRKDDLPIFQRTRAWLEEYFAGKNPALEGLVLAPAGGEFRQAVWKLLLEIRYGETTTYSELAKKIAKLYGRKTMSAQAVGNAVGSNPISIIIPCHRVVGVGGNLTGYAGGIDKKIQLLRLEGVAVDKLQMPKKKKGCSQQH